MPSKSEKEVVYMPNGGKLPPAARVKTFFPPSTT